MSLLGHYMQIAGRGNLEALRRSTFLATNPTPGTGIVMEAASTSRSATAAFMNVYNAATTAQGNYIIPVRLRLVATQANSSASDWRIDVYTDSANRWSSGGSAITEVPLEDSTVTDFTEASSKATIHFGNLTLSAATDENLVGTQTVMKTIFAADDVVDIWFGDAPGSVGPQSTTHLEVVSAVFPPVWIGPGANLSFHGYGASQTDDPAFEFEFLYLERPNQN